MARARTVAGELVRQLNAIDSPVYILDDRLAIVFCHDACATWSGLAAADLQGLVLRYQSSDFDPSSATEASAIPAANGLCPPPQVLLGRAVSATVAIGDTQGVLRERRADFFPVCGAAGDARLIIACVRPESDPHV